jgi:hypothetical protein
MTAPEPLACLDALADTHAKATEGWSLLGGTHEGVVIDDRGDFVCEVGRSRDAAAIVAAHNALPELIAALRAVLALHVASHAWCVVCDRDRDVERLGNNPDCEHRSSFCRVCDTSWPCATYRSLRTPLGPHTTDEETDRG